MSVGAPGAVLRPSITVTGRRAEMAPGGSSLCYIHIQPPALTQTHHTLHHTLHPTPGLDTAHSGNTRSVAPPRDPRHPSRDPPRPGNWVSTGILGAFWIF